MFHHKWPHVLKLACHLHNEQSVLFGDNRDIKSIVRYNKEVSNRFFVWFHENRQYEKGRDLTYIQLLRQAILLIWYEVPMMHQYCLSDANRLLRTMVKETKKESFKLKILFFKPLKS